MLDAGDLRLDPASRRAWRGDVELELTARECALLEFLLRHKGDVVSKREILAHVWDYDFEGDQNIVEVYVRHLRNKLDRPFGSQRDRDPSGVGVPAGRRRWLTPRAHGGRDRAPAPEPSGSARPPPRW